MPDAIANPEELRSFASTLQRFASDLESSMSNLKAQFDSLGETWRDQEQAKFATIFEETMRSLDRFMPAAEEHAAFLQRKAQRLEDYLQQG